MAKKRKPNILRVAVLATATGMPLIVRGDPSVEDVVDFVRVHHQAFVTNAVGGPSGVPAQQIMSAAFYESEDDLADFETVGDEIDISSVFETVQNVSGDE